MVNAIILAILTVIVLEFEANSTRLSNFWGGGKDNFQIFVFTEFLQKNEKKKERTV